MITEICISSTGYLDMVDRFASYCRTRFPEAKIEVAHVEKSYATNDEKDGDASMLRLWHEFLTSIGKPTNYLDRTYHVIDLRIAIRNLLQDQIDRNTILVIVNEALARGTVA